MWCVVLICARPCQPSEVFLRPLVNHLPSSGLEPLRAAGLDAAAVIGRLASGLQLLDPGARLSATELLEHLTQQEINAVIS